MATFSHDNALAGLFNLVHRASAVHTMHCNCRSCRAAVHHDTVFNNQQDVCIFTSGLDKLPLYQYHIPRMVSMDMASNSANAESVIQWLTNNINPFPWTCTHPNDTWDRQSLSLWQHIHSAIKIHTIDSGGIGTF